LREALGGPAPHYAFLLQQHLALIDTLDAHIATLDARIDAAMTPFATAAALVQTLPGVAKRAGPAILAETGMDMSPFPTPEQFASWARLCPGNHESAGKRRPTTTGKGATWLRATLQETAWAAVRTKKSYYRALYHRLKARGGPKKAIVAVQHALLVALWHMLKHGVPHQDLGADYFTRHDTARTRRHHVRRLEQLGYQVQLVEPPAV
jgi:transposase